MAYKKGRLKIGMSTNSRTCQYLRKIDAIYEVVQRWNPYDKKRHDMWGFIDVIAIVNGDIWAIQACGGGETLAHLRTMNNPDVFYNVFQFLTIGERATQLMGTNVLERIAKVFIWSWRKLKRNGREVWCCNSSEIGLNEAEDELIILSRQELLHT